MFQTLRVFLLAAMTLVWACSSTEFASNSKAPTKKPSVDKSENPGSTQTAAGSTDPDPSETLISEDPDLSETSISEDCPLPPAELSVNLEYASGAKTLKVTGAFVLSSVKPEASCGFDANYDLKPGSLDTASNVDFPADRASALSGSKYSLAMNSPGNAAGPTKLSLKVATHGLIGGATVLPDDTINLSGESTDMTWSKAEGEIGTLGFFSTTSNSGAGCPIEANGQQPKSGVRAVVLTKPAPCDFILPEVTVGGWVGGTAIIPIGTYWQYPYSNANAAYMHSAHSFALSPLPAPTIGLDNGFILISPDNKSYLLVDAGVAIPSSASSQSVQTIATQVSETLGFGATTLLRPEPGTAANSYSDATVFKKGSVIAIYDDTPDMAGTINVAALLASVTTNTGISLKWDVAAK